MLYYPYGWSDWLRAEWPWLTKGRKLPVPGWLPHPRDAGFTTTALAERVGQVTDWVLPLKDGSRIHVHEFPDGRLIAHRDPTDPERGPFHAVWHWLFESSSGKLALGIGAVALVAVAVTRSE